MSDNETTSTHDTEKHFASPDVTTSPGSESETEVKQDESVSASETVQDEDVDSDAVQVLPGTGGPDDVGEIEVDPEDLNLNGGQFPGHPTKD